MSAINRLSPISVTSRRAFLSGAAAMAASVVVSPSVAVAHSPMHKKEREVGAELASQWVRTLYKVVQSEGLTPPAAARFYHYTSLTMYEAARPTNRYRSLAKLLHGLEKLPKTKSNVNDATVLSEAVANVALGLLPNASDFSRSLITQHRDAVVAEAVVDAKTQRRSIEHGQAVGVHLLTWMSLDGYNEASSMAFTPPIGPGLWRSTPPNFGTAIEPYWHLIRPAILTQADEVEPLRPLEYDPDPASQFGQQAMATYQQSSANTSDQITIARFWTDNPRVSGLPSGHWFLLLADLAEEDLALDLGETLEAFAKLGVALHDGFLNCWTWKYRYNLLRPVTYIRDHVDSNWSTLVNTPQFPEYTSGHSVASGAAEVVLTTLFGTFGFVDSTGVDRGLPARRFTSFSHAATEAATSRLYGGIHFPMGIENGLIQGREIGHLVNLRLVTRKKKL